MGRCPFCAYSSDDIKKLLDHRRRVHAGEKNRKL